MTEDIWVVSDGAAGNVRQAMALARALAAATGRFPDASTSDQAAATALASQAPAPGEPRVWRLQARAPWRQAAPHRLPGSERAFGDAFRLALSRPPRLAIGCGRLGALATRLLRDAGAKVVQVLDPRIAPHHWDAVVAPEHDRLRGANVVTLQGSLHEIDATWLRWARTRFASLAVLPAPRSLLLLGGPIRNVPLDWHWWQRTRATLQALHAREGGSVSICASRRTPEWLQTAVRRDLAPTDAGSDDASAGIVWLGPADGVNPYAGLLAHADRIIVSPDSVNMLSEAAATGADVRIAGPDVARGKHAKFIASLLNLGAARPLDANAALARTIALNERPRVAARVLEILGGARTN